MLCLAYATVLVFATDEHQHAIRLHVLGFPRALLNCCLDNTAPTPQIWPVVHAELTARGLKGVSPEEAYKLSQQVSGGLQVGVEYKVKLFAGWLCRCGAYLAGSAHRLGL
jgi:hypothetical protein